MESASRETAARRLLTLARTAGIEHIFTNLGSDHPAFIEAFAGLKISGQPMPRVVVCPHEMTALSAAHGYAMITRRPQLVLVHVDVGTQNLGGSIHNAARGRVPAIIIAGLSPVTDGNGPTGTRNEFIHYIQDMPRQAEIVAPYMKWAYELRAPDSVDAVLCRAIQIATSFPEGPVYITGAREVWEGTAPQVPESLSVWPPAHLGPLDPHAASELCSALVKSKRPIVVTSYLGRQPRAVEQLQKLSEKIGIGVCEVSPTYLSFPGGHPHHLGYRRNALVEEADLILLMDVDVPWINGKVSPSPDGKVFHIDIDPLKTGLGYWHFAAHRVYQADSLAVLDQLLALAPADAPGSGDRQAWIASKRQPPQTQPPRTSDGAITPETLTEALGRLVNERTKIIFEAPTCTELIPSILRLSRPGSYLNSGGAGLGWGINAAIGAKLASPDSEIIALVGDGCYMFGVPTSAFWVAMTYGTPFLTVIYNNGGWNAPKFSTIGVHPEGTAKKHDSFWVTVGAGARLADVAVAAGNAEALYVRHQEELAPALERGLATVRSGRCAVVDVAVTRVSSQVLG
jgi:acetolactate synthase-1/2/3 large subunit